MIKKVIEVACDVCKEVEIINEDDYTELDNLIVFDDGKLCLCKDCISAIFEHLIVQHRLAVDLVITKMKRGEF